MMYNAPVKTFVIYSRQDTDYLHQLKLHLKLLKISKKITEVWYDGEIIPGAKWDEEIKKKLNSAELILLLISVDFFNSDYIEKEELQIAFKKHEEGSAVVIPILVRSCVWKAHHQISSLQILPRNADPISAWKHQDDAYTDIMTGIDQAITAYTDKRNEKIAILLYAAINYYNDNKFDEAYNILSKILPTGHPLDGEAAFIYAKIMGVPLGRTPKNEKSAYEWYSYSSKLGNVKAQNNLGVMYLNGWGIPANTEKAIYWFTQSAEGGDEIGCQNLGEFYLYGRPDITKDYIKAEKYLLGAAEKGNSLSQYYLASLYLSGKIDNKPDKEKGFQWLKKSLDQNNSSAQCYWAAILLDGELVDKDVTSAIHWLNLSAEQNNVQALVFLGDLHIKGEGVPWSSTRAAECYRKAIALGSNLAQEKLNQITGK